MEEIAGYDPREQRALAGRELYDARKENRVKMASQLTVLFILGVLSHILKEDIA